MHEVGGSRIGRARGGAGRGLRAHSLAGFAHQAEHLRRVWAITRHVHAQESYRVGDASRGDALGCGRITEHDLDVQAAAEVAAATGLSTYWAEQDVILARALCTRLTGDPGRAWRRAGSTWCGRGRWPSTPPT